MNPNDVFIHLKQGRSEAQINGVRVHFSAHQCFLFSDDVQETACLRFLCDHLLKLPGLAFSGDGPLLKALLSEEPLLAGHAKAVIHASLSQSNVQGIPVANQDKVPDGVETVFLCETRSYARSLERKKIGNKYKILDADLLLEICPEIIPKRAWTPISHHIYPLDVPDIKFEKNLDFLLLDCPARNLALMPNGLAYVHNALKKIPIRSQTFDVDIVTYHRYHIARLFDEAGFITLPSGREMPEDPWQAEQYDLWSCDDVIEYFKPVLDETIEAIVEAKPKILGLSIHACNESFSREVARRSKEKLPDLIVLVGGFSCYNPDIGLKAIPECDYMCIGEADLTIGPLVGQLANGERPFNQAGVLSRFDTDDYTYIPGPMAHNLDSIDFPRYEWFDLSIYRNFNDYQLTPIIASRGCRWSRCTFCAERFFWRIRSAENFVDELEWLFNQGCTLYMFNESDLNGMPDRLMDICDEIIRRGLKIKLTGQLRIHKKSDRAFFDKLREAGMVALRFGVDAFSSNTMRLQKKGYTPAIVSQNLKDCWEAGIFTEVNWVIGVPGETEDDVQEGIDLMIANKPYLGRLANINPLILGNGSVYWLEPEKHNIKFKQPQKELYNKYPRALPADAWHSEKPYIDANVRKVWFDRIVSELYKADFDVGAWAERIISDVKLAKDNSRSATTTTNTSALTLSDEQAEQKEQGPAMRAGSALASKGSKKLDGDFQVIRFSGQWFAYNNDELNQIGKGVIQSKPSMTIKLPEAIRHPRSPAAKLASILPQSVLNPFIRAYRLERSRLQDVPSRTDQQVIGIMLAGLFNLLMNRLRKSLSTNTSQQHIENVRIGDNNAIITRVVSHNATPELMCSIRNYNIVSFDGRYFGVPQGMGIIWEEGYVEKLPGTFSDSTVKKTIAKVREYLGMPNAIEASKAKASTLLTNETVYTNPKFLETVNGYSIVSYEGWVYGIPEVHAGIDLTETDPMELEGVIKDVSREVVQSEIYEGSSAKISG